MVVELLDKASLDELDGASLDGASLDGASLDGASLDDASLDVAPLPPNKLSNKPAVERVVVEDLDELGTTKVLFEESNNKLF